MWIWISIRRYDWIPAGGTVRIGLSIWGFSLIPAGGPAWIWLSIRRYDWIPAGGPVRIGLSIRRYDLIPAGSPVRIGLSICWWGDDACSLFQYPTARDTFCGNTFTLVALGIFICLMLQNFFFGIILFLLFSHLSIILQALRRKVRFTSTSAPTWDRDGAALPRSKRLNYYPVVAAYF